MLQQLATDTGPPDCRVYEERLHMRSIDQQEAKRLVISIDSNGYRRMGQKRADLGINGLSIFGTEKVMGGVHGAPP